jgi:hypothetical protein
VSVIANIVVYVGPEVLTAAVIVNICITNIYKRENIPAATFENTQALHHRIDKVNRPIDVVIILSAEIRVFCDS